MLYQNAIILAVISLNGALVKPHFLMYSDINLGAAAQAKQNTICPFSRPQRWFKHLRWYLFCSPPWVLMSFSQRLSSSDSAVPVQVRSIPTATTASHAAQGYLCLLHTAGKSPAAPETSTAAGRSCFPWRRSSNTAGHICSKTLESVSPSSRPQQPIRVTECF